MGRVAERNENHKAIPYGGGERSRSLYRSARNGGKSLGVASARERRRKSLKRLETGLEIRRAEVTMRFRRPGNAG